MAIHVGCVYRAKKCERFLGFVALTETSGEVIAPEIIQFLERVGLDLQLLRAQGYDGAGNMQGAHRGAGSRIRRLWPKAIVVHCEGHRLNLVVVDSVKGLRLVENAMGMIDELWTFFHYSPKRTHHLSDTRADPKYADCEAGQLHSFCRTRWVQRQSGLGVIAGAYVPIVEALASMDGEGWNTKTKCQAAGLMTNLESTQTMFSIFATKEILSSLKALTVKIQAPALDVFASFNLIEAVKAELQFNRDHVDTYHAGIWATMMKTNDALELSSPRIPRRARLQQHRDNTPADTVETYYRRTVTTPLLDRMIVSLGERFDDSSSFMALFHLMPSEVIKLPLLPGGGPDIAQWLALLTPALDMYRDDLAALTGGVHIDDAQLRAELRRWWLLWKAAEDHPMTVAPVLQSARRLKYQYIGELLHILLTMPVSTCDCERSMSAKRRLKTYLRATMGQDRFSSLVNLHVNSDLEVDLDELMKKFANNKGVHRRANFYV